MPCRRTHPSLRPHRRQLRPQIDGGVPLRSPERGSGRWRGWRWRRWRWRLPQLLQLIRRRRAARSPGLICHVPKSVSITRRVGPFARLQRGGRRRHLHDVVSRQRLCLPLHKAVLILLLQARRIRIARIQCHVLGQLLVYGERIADLALPPRAHPHSRRRGRGPSRRRCCLTHKRLRRCGGHGGGTGARPIAALQLLHLAPHVIAGSAMLAILRRCPHRTRCRIRRALR